MVGFAHCWVGPYVWRHHLDIFRELSKGLRGATSGNPAEESPTAQKDTPTGALHSQAEFSLVSPPLLCQLINPSFSQREVHAEFGLWKTSASNYLILDVASSIAVQFLVESVYILQQQHVKT